MRERAKRIWTMTLGFLFFAARDCRAFPPFLARHFVFIDRSLPLVENLPIGEKAPPPSADPLSPVRPSTGPLHRPGV